MEQQKTDKKLLGKGLKIMFLALLCMFTGPTLVHIASINKDKDSYVILLTIAIIICIIAVYFMYNGLQTIANSIFKK